MPITRFSADSADLRSRFKTQFSDANPSIRVFWEGQPEDFGGDPFPDIDDEFVRFMMRQNDSRQVSTGNGRCFRHTGTVSIFIQTEAGKGTKRNETIADLVGRAMGSVSVGGIVLRDPRFQLLGKSRTGWIRSVVTIPYFSTFQE